MKKSIIIVIVILCVICIAAAIVMLNNKAEDSDALKIANIEELKELANKIYEGKEESLPSLYTEEIDISDSATLSMYTGLKDNSNIEFALASEPMMTSVAYSMVLLKVKDDADTNKIAKDICDNVDERKWICVSAEKIYTTSSGNVVILVMSNEETANTIYSSFKDIVKNVKQEYNRNEKEIELPDEMY